MRRLLLLLGSLSALAFAFQQAPGRFIISGTMVEHATNRPLSGVLVILSPNAAPNQQLTVITGSDGRFTFTNCPAAKYSLLAQRRGDPEIYGYLGTEGYSTGIVTGPNFQTTNLVFPLEAPASIAGTVLDEGGEPVNQAMVILLRKWVISGRHQVSQMPQKMTSSSGRFRFAHLAPGTYFIAVQARPWYARNPGPAPDGTLPENARELDLAYPVTYYGDTTNGAAAAPITLAEGASVTVQIDLRAVAAIHVPVSGVDPQGGGLAGGLFAEGPGGVPMPTGMVVGMGSSYELWVAPGHYRVELQGFSRDSKMQASVHQTVDLSAGSTISLQSASSISVSGQVVFEGVDRPVEGAGVVLTNGTQRFDTQVQPDGSFSFSGRAPLPGRYEVYSQNVPDGYVKSVTAKGAAVSGDTVEIADGASVQLSVVVGKGVRAKLDGIALKDGKPRSGAMILLLPQDLNRTLLTRRDQSDSDGTFTLPEIVPGRYTLLAIDDGRDLAYQEPAVIQPYLRERQLIDIPMIDDTPVKVNVVSRRRD
jgi:hypothetical protein